MPIANQQIIPVRPTVFVGLGGTGKEILLRLRMKFYERYGQVGYPCMSYLWIDTDMQNQNVDREEMDVILQRVLLSEGETVDIQVMDATDFLDNPGNYSWITNWMPPAVTGSGLRIQDGAGQIRSKGRFAFYWNFDRNANVQGKLLNAVDKVRMPQARLETANFSNEHNLNLSLDPNWGTVVNFFVVSSLAGGTGSGIFLDVAFLARHLASGANQNFRPDITGLLFLSSLFTGSPQDRRSGNSYAALKELEYYNYTPEARARDVDGGGAPAAGQQASYALRKFEEKWSKDYPAAPVNGPPFNTCYLIDGYTFGGTPVTPDHKYEVFDMASEYLFWEFYRGEFASQKRSLRPNNRQYLDRNLAVPHGDEQSPFHMQRFSTGYSSFGLSWIRVPLGSRIAACAYRLSQEILEYWERGGLLNREKAEAKLKGRNIVEEVRLAVRGEPLRFSGERLIVDLATTARGTKFSALLKDEIRHFYDQQTTQTPAEYVAAFEDRCIARRVGATIFDNIEPNKTRVLDDYKKDILGWILGALKDEGFIPLLGFLDKKSSDGTQRKISGYLDSLNDVILPEISGEIAAAADDFANRKADAEERKAVFFANYDELEGNFILFKKTSRRILVSACLEAEENYAEAVTGEWLCEVAHEVIGAIRDYVSKTQSLLKKFADEILSPIIGEFRELRSKHEAEDERALSINLYRNLDEYYKLRGNAVDVGAEKEQLFSTRLPNLWDVVTTLTEEKFRETVENYGWKRFQDEFQRRFAAGSTDEPLANAVQLFNETYPPSDPIQRTNQITIFIGGGKPYIQPRLALGPRAPQPHEDIVLGMRGISVPPGKTLFDELRSKHGLSQAQGIETEPEAILYYHELTGFPLYYLSSLEQYRASYGVFQGRLGELPMHFHRRVDMFPEIFLYAPPEARAVFNAWEMVILGALLRVMQMEPSRDDFNYFYYSGRAADTKLIGDEKGTVSTFVNDATKFAWCGDEINKRKNDIFQDFAKLEVFYGTLQILNKEIFISDSVRLADGKIVSLPSFQSSVIAKYIHEAEQSVNGANLPHNTPGQGTTSPAWEALINKALAGATEVRSERGGRTERRLFINSMTPFTLM